MGKSSNISFESTFDPPSYWLEVRTTNFDLYSELKKIINEHIDDAEVLLAGCYGEASNA